MRKDQISSTVVLIFQVLAESLHNIQQQYTFSHSCQMFNIVLTQQLMIACVYLRCIIENQLILRFFWTVCREILVLSLLSFPISPTIGCPNVLIALHQTQKMVIFHLPKKKSWSALQCCQLWNGSILILYFFLWKFSKVEMSFSEIKVDSSFRLA